MTRTNEDRAVVTPLLGAGALGTGAYISHLVDNKAEEIGIRKGLKLNPEALDALDYYANLRPDKSNPAWFSLQYSNAANRVGSSQLFLNDPRKTWEWEINSPQLRRGIRKALDELATKGDGLTDHLETIKRHVPAGLGGKLFDKLNGLIGRGTGFARNFYMLSPLLDQLQHEGLNINTPGGLKNGAKALSHTPEMSQSPLKSYVRLLNEIAGGTQTQQLADQTVEALVNYKHPTFAPYRGRSFSSPSEYFSEITGSKHLPGLYDQYLGSFSNAVKNNPTNIGGGLMHEVRRLLAPTVAKAGDKPIHELALLSELNKVVGRQGEWKLDPAGYKLTRVGDGRLASGIRSIQDIIDKSLTHPGLLFLNARAAQSYGQTGKGYGKMVSALKWTQRVRDPRLRLALGLGTAGLTGLGGYNIYKNRERHNSIPYRISKLLHRQG